MRAALLRTTINSPALWTPSTVSNLSDYIGEWWTADDHGTANMTDDGAGLISQWKSRISGLAVTAATTARPTWSATAMNLTRPGLTFDGVANCFVATSMGSMPVGSSAGELWAVLSAVSGVSRTVVSYGAATAGQRRQINISATNLFTPSDGTTADNGPSALGNHATAAQFSGATLNAWTDGTGHDGNPTTISTLNTGSMRIRIGAQNNTGASGFHQGVISEILVPKVLTDSVQLTGRASTLKQLLEGWAAWKYGFATQLHPLHPFRWRPPAP